MTKTNGLNGSGSNGHAVPAIDPKVATSPSSPGDLQRLLQEVNAQSMAFNDGDSEARLRLVDAARSLMYAMQTPQEAMLHYCWAEPVSFAAIETCINLGVFTILAQADEPKSVEDLAAQTGAEPELLVVTGSRLQSLKRYNDAWPAINGSTIPAVFSLPTWLKQNNYRIPTEGTNCPFNLGLDTKDAFFEFLNSKNPKYPELGAQFNNLMSAYHQGRPSWMDEHVYPVNDNLIKGAKISNEEVFLVDVGGNKGHDLEEFKSKWPNAPGKLILQDQPHVLADIASLHPAIEPMIHDFFTEQPVKGARVYFLQSILHDWNDQNCQKILSQLVAAMTPGYSKLLINENVVPDTGAHWQATSLDLIMMIDLGAKERTKQQWHRLIEPVGLKISKIWTSLNSAESVIECELA